MRPTINRDSKLLFWVHLGLRMAGAQIIFWMLLSVLKVLDFDIGLRTVDFWPLIVALPLASFLEIALRPERKFSLRYSRCDICNLCQREVLFVLIAILTFLILKHTEWQGRLFFGMFFALFAFWSMFINYVGHRLVTLFVARFMQSRF